MKKSSLILVLILVLAFSLRIWGINYGLPYLYNPDEPVNFDNVLSIIKGEQPNQFFYHYPPLFFYIQAYFYKSLSFLSNILDCCGYQNFPNMQVISSGNGYIDNPIPILGARMLTVLFSLGIVVLVFYTAKIVTGSFKAAAVASILVAISPIQVENAKWITLNTYVAFFSMATILVSIILLRSGSLRIYILAGLLAGLAASSKYNGAIVLLAPLLAHFLRLGLKGIFSWKIYSLAVAFLVGFLITTPTIVLDSPRFIGGLNYDLAHYTSGHVGAEGQSFFYYIVSLAHKETAILMFSLLAIAFVRNRLPKELIILAIFVVVYIVVLSRFEVRFDHHLILVIGPLSIIASYSIAKLNNLFRIIILILVAISLFQTVSINVSLTRDERAAARGWISQNIPVGSKIVVEDYGPWINPQKYQLLGVSSLINYPPTWYMLHKIEYLVAAEVNFGRFFAGPKKYQKEIRQYQTIFQSFKEIKTFNDYGYEIRLFKIID